LQTLHGIDHHRYESNGIRIEHTQADDA
jgi:hypothetical protein